MSPANHWRLCCVGNSSVIHWTFRRHVASSNGTKKFGDTRSPCVLGNLVLQYQVIAKRIPRQIGDQPVILMPVLAVVSEDDVWRVPLLQLFKTLLDVVPDVRKETVPEGPHLDLCVGCSLQKPGRARLRLNRPLPCRTEDHPVARSRSHEWQAASAACRRTDLEIVGMRTETQDLQRRATMFGQRDVQHGLSERRRGWADTCTLTAHVPDAAAAPRRSASPSAATVQRGHRSSTPPTGRHRGSTMSSSNCLSLKVSMGSQKPSWR